MRELIHESAVERATARLPRKIEFTGQSVCYSVDTSEQIAEVETPRSSFSKIGDEGRIVRDKYNSFAVES